MNPVIRRKSVPSPLLAASLAALLASLAVPAWAVPFSSDLAITGSVGFDSGYAAANLAGTGTQDGSFRAVQGGATSSSTFTGPTVSGGNPLSGTLTDLGDGFGFIGRASASGDNTPGAPLYGIGIDVGLNVANNSGTDTYKVTFNIDFSHQVNSAGDDAYADSNFTVFDRAGNQDIFFTDLLSDTLFGNEIGGQPTGSSGGAMSEAGPFSFAITLLAGQSFLFDPTLHDLSWTLTGGSFAQNASSSTLLDAYISIAAVENLTGPGPGPNPTPEPATLALLGLGLAGLGVLRRRGAR